LLVGDDVRGGALNDEDDDLRNAESSKETDRFTGEVGDEYRCSRFVGASPDQIIAMTSISDWSSLSSSSKIRSPYEDPSERALTSIMALDRILLLFRLQFVALNAVDEDEHATPVGDDSDDDEVEWSLPSSSLDWWKLRSLAPCELCELTE